MADKTRRLMDQKKSKLRSLTGKKSVFSMGFMVISWNLMEFSQQNGFATRFREVLIAVSQQVDLY